MAGEQTAVLPQSDPGSFRMNEQPNNRIMLNGLPILGAPFNAHQAVVPEFSWVWAWGG
jgi:hypothetical protein